MRWISTTRSREEDFSPGVARERTASARPRVRGRRAGTRLVDARAAIRRPVPPSDDFPRAAKNGAGTKRVRVQLRRHARGNTPRSGLAGRSLPCKKGFGLALKRSDGERHHARGRVASNGARDTGGHNPRGGWEPGPIRRLDRGCYWDKRERERERCVSAADTSTYGPCWARGNPWHVCPHRTHAKTAPSPKRYRSLSKRNPLLRYKVDH